MNLFGGQMHVRALASNIIRTPKRSKIPRAERTSGGKQTGPRVCHYFRYL